MKNPNYQTAPEKVKLPLTSVTNSFMQKITDDVFCLTVQIVNVCMLGNPRIPHGWVLVDSGLTGKEEAITEALMKQFGEVNPPSCIILTHGHFDHVGSAYQLSERWDVPIYIHPEELPYVKGEKAYVEPDATVEGGLVAKLSRFFPNEPINLKERIRPLPEELHMQGLEKDWRFIHVPGHSPGQIALFRDKDRILLSADAIITVRQDEWFDVLTQKQEMQGPPRYFTNDWKQASQSAQKLAALEPMVLVPGHGLPFFGEDLKRELNHLIDHFSELAVPEHGKYV